jgi:hypothetical protein
MSVFSIITVEVVIEKVQLSTLFIIFFIFSPTNSLFYYVNIILCGRECERRGREKIIKKRTYSLFTIHTKRKNMKNDS